MYTSSLNTSIEEKAKDSTAIRSGIERVDGVLYYTPQFKVTYGSERLVVTEEKENIELTDEEEKSVYEQTLRKKIL